MRCLLSCSAEPVTHTNFGSRVHSDLVAGTFREIRVKEKNFLFLDERLARSVRRFCRRSIVSIFVGTPSEPCQRLKPMVFN